ncbi:MAG: formate dehydrogenase accessory protein FdhE [Isosphaeraceae bacterium]
MALRDLFGRASRPVPAASSPAQKPVDPDLGRALDELARLSADRPELAESATTLARVLAAVFDPTLAQDVPPHADSDLILAAWNAGVPAFRAGESGLAWDENHLKHRGMALCSALGDRGQARAMEAAIQRGHIHLGRWARAALSDDAGVDLGSTEIPPDFAQSFLRLVLMPDLARRSAWLATLRPEGAWNQGNCPNCGEPPVLAESRGLDQRRYLRCGLCAADWSSDRLRCPFCAEADHRQLGYRFVEGEEHRYRLAHCGACGGWLPVVSTLAAISPPGLLVAELATAHLTALMEAS